MSDLSFNIGDGYFFYRVGAIIIHDNCVLMIKNENFPYYYSIGGRVQFGETAKDAVLREAFEETNISFEIEKLAFIHENFSIADWLGGCYKPFHEISLYFLMKPHNDIANVKCNSKGADGGMESLHWLPIDELSNYHLFPEFFKTELKNLKNDVRHFITKDGRTFIV